MHLEDLEELRGEELWLSCVWRLLKWDCFPECSIVRVFPSLALVMLMDVSDDPYLLSTSMQFLVPLQLFSKSPILLPEVFNNLSRELFCCFLSCHKHSAS